VDRERGQWTRHCGHGHATRTRRSHLRASVCLLRAMRMLLCWRCHVDRMVVCWVWYGMTHTQPQCGKLVPPPSQVSPFCALSHIEPGCHSRSAPGGVPHGSGIMIGWGSDTGHIRVGRLLREVLGGQPCCMWIIPEDVITTQLNRHPPPPLFTHTPLIGHCHRFDQCAISSLTLSSEKAVGEGCVCVPSSAYN
jgi:hypothetical protein